MRNKTANEICKILKYLVSPDKELVNLGVNLFRSCYLVTQLNKHKKFELGCSWPGFDSHKPAHFIVENRYRAKFTKGQFIKMLESQTVPVYTKAGYVLNFIYNITSDTCKPRDVNYQLHSAILHGSFKDEIIGEQSTLSGKHYSHYCEIKNKFAEQLYDFRTELEELELRFESYRWDKVYDCIADHKIGLQSEYNKYKRRKWFNDHKEELGIRYNLTIKDLHYLSRYNSNYGLLFNCSEFV